MDVKQLIWSLAAASLIAPGSVGIATTGPSQHVEQAAAHMRQNSTTLPRAVREGTGRFRDVDDAIAEGYVQFQGCVSGAEEGAMGVHYVKPELFDDQLEVDHPEALVYEPKRGRFDLVAVEYITVASAWHATHDPDTPPDLMGHLFHYAPGPNRYGKDAFYELHVWAWRDNPRGIFADFNPNVSCAGF